MPQCVYTALALFNFINGRDVKWPLVAKDFPVKGLPRYQRSIENLQRRAGIQIHPEPVISIPIKTGVAVSIQVQATARPIRTGLNCQNRPDPEWHIGTIAKLLEIDFPRGRIVERVSFETASPPAIYGAQ